MALTRRGTLWVGLGGVVALALPGRAVAARLEDVRNAFVGSGTVTAGGITLTAPEIAENGSSVPISVEAPGAVAILLLASGNPEPSMATFTFGPAAGRQMAATRVRLAQTQDVVALARMADGSVLETKATVQVTIGGCTG
jgi:sulfur-oxidizing protein SoxY